MTDILMIAPMHPVCMEQIATLGTVRELWKAEDRDAFLAEHGPKIEVVATDGHHGCKPELMDRLPSLKLVSSYGVGYDNIDVPAANARGVAVTNTPDVLNDAMAELTVGLMIAHSRRIVEAEAWVRTGAWAQKGNFPLTTELTNKTVGILGLGRIGKEIARRLEVMKMKVVYHGRREQADQPFGYFASLKAMAEAADWLIVIAPGTPETVKLVDAEIMNALGPRGVLVNMARGPIVDESALVEALKDGRLGGAVLDVFVDEPRPHPELPKLANVTLSPHAGSGTEKTRAGMGQLVVDNIKAYLAGAPLLTEVKS